MNSIEFVNDLFFSFFSVWIAIFLDLFLCYYLDIDQRVHWLVEFWTCGVVNKIIHIATIVIEAGP